MQFRYKAIQVKQSKSDKKLTIFHAPAFEIDSWAGVPQKKRFGTAETTGFQRVESKGRISQICQFYQNEENIIQNPLLCSTRQIRNSTIKFEKINSEDSDNDVLLGNIIIEIPDFKEMLLIDLLEITREYIENRIPELKATLPSVDLIATLKEQAYANGHISPEYLENAEATQVEIQENSSSSNDNGVSTSVLFEESHIVDYWQEVAARHEILKELETPYADNSFLGFSCEGLISYLCPIVLVDGQHRLRGAIEAAKQSLNLPEVQEEIATRIADNNESPEQVEIDILTRQSRKLPISLMMSSDPAEQVFQFVVVNQKATPIGRALLGTIVSTTLTNSEMQSVARRLKDSGIPLEESQAVTFLARSEESPFCNLIERGLTGDATDLLQWNVFSSLISIFRELKGGKPFGQKNDYADVWRRKYLDKSDITANFESNDCDSAFDYWRKLDGPWRNVFIKFWSCVRDEFGNTSTPGVNNYWGNPRNSNLFNKISLTILAADFFQFLTEMRKPIESIDSIPELVEDWLEDVNRDYFNRDWRLTGVKKDSTGIKNQWAFIWSEYRKNPTQLPDVRLFRQAKGD